MANPVENLVFEHSEHLNEAPVDVRHSYANRSTLPYVASMHSIGYLHFEATKVYLREIVLSFTNYRASVIHLQIQACGKDAQQDYKAILVLTAVSFVPTDEKHVIDTICKTEASLHIMFIDPSLIHGKAITSP